MSAPRIIKRTPDLGLKIRLQPVADAGPPASPAPECNATGVAWLVRPSYVYESSEWGDYAWWSLPGLETIEVISASGGGLEYDATPRPDTFIRAGTPYYYEDYPVPEPVVFVAAPIGPAVRGVEWSSTLTGSAQFSIEIDVSGPIAWVTLHPVNISDLEPDFANLTLTARCGDSVIGELRLQVIHEGF